MTAPASGSTVNTNPNNAPPSSIHANVIPSEVGWQFVPQYYTFVNKQPHRLHCFYTRNSTFIHGTEGEDGRPCYGQQEIHNKIVSIGYQDCKVFIHSVDAQSSANGGIIIQVIGEMSNRGEPWRKFAQTFFLAEQPNGYFVLNDIFRFLKEESVDAEDEDQAHDQADLAVASQPPSDIIQEVAQDPAVPMMKAMQPNAATATPDHTQPSHGSVPPGKPATPEVHVLEPVPVAVDEKPTPNGIHHHPPAAAEPEPALPAPPVPQAEPTKPPTEPVAPPVPPAETPQPAAPSPPASQPATSPAPVPAVAPTTTAVSAPSQAAPSAAVTKPASSSAPVPSPKPAAPAAPKTWANLAAANSNKWGPQVAQEARGVSAAPPPPPPPSSQKPEVHRTGGVDKETRDVGRELHPAHQAALSVATPQCFVKSVTEVISHQALSGALTTRFGAIKELEIVRTKACAFLEFTTLDAARRAIVASLPVSAGGDGGVRIELEGGGSARISVETRKERGERPPPRPRTGGPGPDRGGGGGGGGFRGASGRGRGTGRGAAPGGSKP